MQRLKKIIRKLNISLLYYLLILAVFLSSKGVLYFNNELIIYFLDVGQGDSILIQTPDDKFILIDSGPDDSVMTELGRVLPFGYKHLDLVIFTHPDLDHIGGGAEILKYFEVGAIAFEDLKHKSYAVSELKRLIETEKFQRLNINDRKDLMVGCCLKLDFVWPNLDFREPIEEVNDLSVGMIISYSNFRLFAAGDLSSKYEEWLVENGYLGDVDILKVNHHGSQTSTSLTTLEYTQPEYAVIPVGAENKYGHPHKSVLKNLESENVDFLRTDLSGTIKLRVENTGHYSFSFIE